MEVLQCKTALGSLGFGVFYWGGFVLMPFTYIGSCGLLVFLKSGVAFFYCKS